MELRHLVRDIFLFAATFRERLDAGSLPALESLKDEVTGMFTAIDNRALADPSMKARYEKARYGLVALVDETIMTSTWPDAPQWPILEMTYYGTNLVGNRLLEAMNKLTPADSDMVEICFYILALGFRGEFAYDEAKWEEMLLRLYRMLPNKLEDSDFKLTPDAYNVVRRKAQRLDPLFNLWRSVLVFGAAVVLIIIFYQVVWVSRVGEARAKSQEVLQHLRDDGLRRSLMEDAGP